MTGDVHRLAAGTDVRESAEIDARIDRLPQWGLSRMFFGVLGLSYFFAFYDITAIGVALPPTLAHLGLPTSASGPPVTWGLMAYIVGSFAFGGIADAIGRRAALRLSIGVLAAGSLLTAFSWDLLSLTVFRALTGVGIGAQIAIAATMAGEFANRSARGRYIAMNAVWGALGFVVTPFVGILLLPLPRIGWRLLFAVGALSVVMLPLCRDRWLPESPRWLAARGRTDAALSVVARMEGGVAARTGAPLPPVEARTPVAPAAEDDGSRRVPVARLLSAGLLPRLALVFAFWFFWYLWTYGFLGYAPTLLHGLGLSMPSGLLAHGLGNLGFLIGGLLAPVLIDRLERKFIVLGGALVAALGFVLLATATPQTVVIGGLVVGFGNFVAISSGYAYTSEVFPTAARGSAMAIGDGLGHIGGAVAPFLVLPLLDGFGPRGALWSLAAIAAISALIISAGLRTTRRSLIELAP